MAAARNRTRWQPFSEVMVSPLHGDAKRLHELRLGLVVNRTVPQMFAEGDWIARALRRIKDYRLPWEGFAEGNGYE
jgi:hypothetical protein